MNEKIQKFIGSLLVGIAILFLAVVGFRSCVISKHEYGFLGVDEDGRSALVYHLNSGSPTSVTFYTEFFDHPFISRLWRPPMNCTLRMKQYIDEENEVAMRINEGLARKAEILKPLINNFLMVKADPPLYGYDPICLSKNNTVPANEFMTIAREKGVQTARDMLRGFGFTTFEWVINGEKKTIIQLNTNVLNGTEGFFTVLGSASNHPCDMAVDYIWGWKKELPKSPPQTP